MKITSFEIRNFRTFKHLRLTGLERVNLITGDNNVGKTALLEALWQFSGPDMPDLGLRLDQFRGLHVLDADELLFDLFYGYDASSPIELTASGDWGANPRRLWIETRARETSRVLVQENGQGGEGIAPVAESPHEVVLRYTDGASDYESSGWFTARRTGPEIALGIEVKVQHVPARPTGHYFSPRYRNPPQEEANRLGQMALHGLEGSVVEVLQRFEPRLRRLSTVSLNGVPVIHADIGMGRLIPMGMLGDGIQRVLSWALAFQGASGGMVLLDEIENGIHHSKLAELWRAVSRFSDEFNVQLFATTHSLECIRAAHHAFSESEKYDFRLFRLDRINGDLKVKSLDQTVLDTAFRADLEIR